MERTRIRAALLCVTLGAIIILFARTALAGPIREAYGSSQTLIPIRTTLGFSTILEFPLKPISAVLGDQDAVKLEYVGESITLKPLTSVVRTNLFVFTQTGRYAFSIQNGPPSAVDYIVRVRDRESKQNNSPTNDESQSTFRPVLINRKAAIAGVFLAVSRIQLSKDAAHLRAASLIEFEISSNRAPYNFKPTSFGLKQDGRFLDAESITIDRPWVAKGLPSSKGIIAVLNQDWDRRKPLTLVFAFEANGKKPTVKRVEVSFSAVAMPHAEKTPGKETQNGKIELFPKAHP